MLLNRRQLSVAVVASDDPSRPSLTGVCIRPDGTTEATDGHVLLRVTPSPAAPAEAEFPRQAGSPADPQVSAPFILPAAAALDIMKAIPKSRLPILEHARLESLNGTVIFVTTDLDTTRHHEARPVEGPYPNTDQVIPEGEPVFSIGFDLGLLEHAVKAMRFGDRYQAVGRFDFYGPLRGCKITRTLPTGERALALVMPHRIPDTL